VVRAVEEVMRHARNRHDVLKQRAAHLPAPYGAGAALARVLAFLQQHGAARYASALRRVQRCARGAERKAAACCVRHAAVRGARCRARACLLFFARSSAAVWPRNGSPPFLLCGALSFLVPYASRNECRMQRAFFPSEEER